MHKTPSGDWSGSETEIKKIATESAKAFDPATVANALELLALMRDRCPIPEVAKGYGSTIRFCWGGNLEIEVFPDHVEAYRFRDQHTDIWHYAHRPGAPFSTELMSELPVLPEPNS